MYLHIQGFIHIQYMRVSFYKMFKKLYLTLSNILHHI